MEFFKKLLIKLVDFVQKINDWCYAHDDGKNFDNILNLQIMINKFRVEHNLFDTNGDFLQ